MRTIILDTNYSILDNVTLALSIRVGYLLAKEATFTGSIAAKYVVINSEKSFNNKLEFTKINSPKEIVDTVIKGEACIKEIRKKKIKNSMDILTLKKMEKIMETFFDMSFRIYKEIFFGYGYMDISNEMMQQGDCSYIILDDTESSQNDDTCQLTELLLTQQDEDTFTFLFSLPAEFFQYQPVIDIMQNEDYQMENNSGFCLHHIITLPGIVALTTSEMQLVKRRIIDSATTFHIASNKWLDMFYKPSISLKERIAFLKETVVESAKSLQEDLDQNQVLQDLKKHSSTKTTLHVYIGEVPVSLLWQFYRDKKLISDKDWKILEEGLQKDERLSGNFPVMVAHSPFADNKEDDEQKSTDNIMSSKKSINVD